MINNTKSQQKSDKEFFNDIISIIMDLNFTSKKYCLFIDLDGTIADFQIDPLDSFIPSCTLNTIQKINNSDVPVIAVTGRDIISAQRLLSDLKLPIAALHGLEIYLKKDNRLSFDTLEIDFKPIHQAVLERCMLYPELLIENKKIAVALHYRKCPTLEKIAHEIMEDINKKFPHLSLKKGKFVLELISPHANKGKAIDKIIHYLEIADYTVLFIGDDVTDEDGFKIVNNLKNGISIKVGQGKTEAKYRLKDTTHVAKFLKLFSEYISCTTRTKSVELNGEKYV